MARDERLKPVREIKVDNAGQMQRTGRTEARSDVILSVRNVTKSFLPKRSQGFGARTSDIRTTVAVNDVTSDIQSW